MAPLAPSTAGRIRRYELSAKFLPGEAPVLIVVIEYPLVFVRRRQTHFTSNPIIGSHPVNDPIGRPLIMRNLDDLRMDDLTVPVVEISSRLDITFNQNAFPVGSFHYISYETCLDGVE